MRLVLRERGAPVAVSPADWRNFRLEETVGTLAHNGILRIDRTSAAIILSPRNFVGEMRAANVSLTILPKDQALYEAILGLALQFDGKHARNYEETTDQDEGADQAAAFLESLVSALEDGLPWQYLSTEEITSHPRGKLRVGRIVTNLISKGVRHQVLANRHERKQIRAFVNVVWAAYLSLSMTQGSIQSLMADAARLIEALDPQDSFDVAEIVSAAEEFLEQNHSERRSARRLTEVALAILARDNVAGRSTMFVPTGVAYFSNLERHWERAVAQLVSQALLSTDLVVKVHGLAAHGLKLFGDAGPMINPDVVAVSVDGSVDLVVDAKYKMLSKGEFAGIASDVYQLTSYVNRTRPQTGLLVYLGSKDSVTTLGKAECGASVSVVAISSTTLRSLGQDSLAKLLTAL